MNKTTQKSKQTDPYEAFREHVQGRELEAREAKAIYDRYYYVIEASKLRDEFNAVMQKNFELQMQMKDEQSKLIEAAKENALAFAKENGDALPEEGS